MNQDMGKKRINGLKSVCKTCLVGRFLLLQESLGLINKSLKMREKRDVIFYNSFQFATGALEHRAHEVREVVLRIIFAMYREHRAAVLEYLPPDEAGARKTVRYKTLFDGFAKIDGKSSETEMRVRKERAECTGPLQTRQLAE